MTSFDKHEKGTSDEGVDKSHYPADPTRHQQGDEAGEDEGSAPKEGDDSHLKEDQKPITH